MDREDIYIISKHSNWKEDRVQQLLEQEVYSDKLTWKKFLRLLFISLGVGFTTAGIIFFFAYNWADLHKFAKLGVVEVVVIGLSAVLFFSKAKPDIKNVLLTGLSVMVGILFTVFGQIYQTGANAYDLFLIWTISIILWVAISNFAPLWLIFVTLVNTTFILYLVQVEHDWSPNLVAVLFFVINSLFLIGALCIKTFSKKVKVPNWFTNILALTAITYATLGMCYGIFEDRAGYFLLLLLLTTIAYIGGIKYGLKEKRGFYLAVIPFSIIIIISNTLVELFGSDLEELLFLGLSVFILVSVTLVIINLRRLQKKWEN